MHCNTIRSLKAAIAGCVPFATLAVLLGCIVSVTCCCTEDRIVIEMHHVDLSDSQAEIVRAEKLIKDFGLEVEDVEYGARNGTFINITVTGREKRFAEKYFDERQKRLELEKRLRGAKASD